MGADTFDCVAPTREARHGKIYTRYGNINLANSRFKDSMEPLDDDCDCPVCKAGWTKGQLRELLKSQDKEKRYLYFNLASQHNLRFILRLTEEARQALIDHKY